jgi:hypothetical protein
MEIDSVVGRIRRESAELSEAVSALRSERPELARPVEKQDVSLSACAVDGGLLSRRMHGADIILSRAVGVNFIYEGSRLTSFGYHPGKKPEPRLEVMESLDEHESAVFRSLVRLRDELACAISTRAKFSPALLLMDGSLLPLPSDRPAEGSPLQTLYGEVLSSYQKLFDDCRAGGCLLCGVIKDSRSRKLAGDLGFRCSDSLLCMHLLDEGRMTVPMPYFDEKPNRDIADLAAGVEVFYIRPSSQDIPLRIETREPARAAPLIYGLSAISQAFAYPAILIEADMCAAMDGTELEPLEAALRSAGLRPLRRDSRPFR